MGWIWLGSVWEDFEHLLLLLEHVAAFTYLCEADGCTVAHAIHKYLDLRGHLEQVCMRHLMIAPFILFS